MNDFLDRECVDPTCQREHDFANCHVYWSTETELNLTEDIAELAAKAVVKTLVENVGWFSFCKQSIDGEVYRAPEFRR